MEDFDFEKDLSINKFKLDEECMSHPSIYFKYADAQREAKNEVSRLKDKLELVKAEQNTKIRDELTKAGTKVTEALINAELAKNNKVQIITEKLRTAEDVYAKLSVAVQAFEHRKSELDNMVKLYCSGYFSTVGNSGSKNDITEQTQKTIRKNMNHKE